MSNYLEGQDLNIAKINYSDIDPDDLEKIGTGSTSVIYKHEDVAIKVYNHADYNCKWNIEIELFEKLKEIKLKGFMELIDYSSVICKDPMDSLAISFPSRKIVKAYSYKYIEESPIKSIDLPIEYSLCSLYELNKFMKELNIRGIQIVDAHGENCIPSKNNIVIIDPDSYILSRAYITERNLCYIREYLFSLWFKEYGIKRLSSQQQNEFKNMLSDGDVAQNIENLSLKFKVNTPRKIIDNYINNV